ncbi:MAG: hypothetical protein ACRDRA_19660 [Pseudonocardiaceae bacterium]
MASERRNEVSITGGTFTGVNLVGQHNTATMGPVLVGPERDQALTQLRQLVDTLRAQLEQPGGGTDQVKASVHAEHMSEELATEQPDSGRVHKIWNQMKGLLTTPQFGANVAAISEAISKLF